MVTPCDRSCRGQSCCGCCGSPPGLHQTGTLWQPYDEKCCHRTQKDQPLACMHLQGRLRREWIQDIEENELRVYPRCSVAIEHGKENFWMVDFIATLIAFVVYCGLSWLVTVGIIKLITLCFGWSFSLLTATGIWLILALARSVFKSRNSDK